jgi:hypothetical protein
MAQQLTFHLLNDMELSKLIVHVSDVQKPNFVTCILKKGCLAPSAASINNSPVLTLLQ